MPQDDSEKTPPTSEPAPERPSAPSSESAPAPAAAPTSRFAAWWSAPATVLTVLFVIVVLLALTVVFGMLAFRRDQATRASGETVVTLSPAPTRPAPPARPTGGAPTPPRPDAVPPVDPNVLGITYTSGSFRANDGAYIDFDDDNLTGRRTDESDVAVDAFGVTGLAAVPLSVFGREADPTRHDCASIPPQEWEVTVPTERLDEGTRVCFRTDEERYGFFVVMGTRLTSSGGLIGLELSYQVWEGPRDGEGDKD